MTFTITKIIFVVAAGAGQRRRQIRTFLRRARRALTRSLWGCLSTDPECCWTTRPLLISTWRSSTHSSTDCPVLVSWLRSGSCSHSRGTSLTARNTLSSLYLTPDIPRSAGSMVSCFESRLVLVSNKRLYSIVLFFLRFSSRPTGCKWFLYLFCRYLEIILLIVFFIRSLNKF